MKPDFNTPIYWQGTKADPESLSYLSLTEGGSILFVSGGVDKTQQENATRIRDTWNACIGLDLPDNVPPGTLTHAAKLLAKWHNWIASGQLAFKPEDLEESGAVLRALGLPAMDMVPVSPRTHEDRIRAEYAASENPDAVLRKYKIGDIDELGPVSDGPPEPFDNTQAELEGWLLVNQYEDPDIQRFDEAKVFATDDDAIAFVRGKARDGSEYHSEALRLAGLTEDL